MTPVQTHTFTLQSPDETATFAAQIGQHLIAGDTVLLEGDVGAGKTHFARALIQSRLAVPEDVPSPTFTLVQTYDGLETDIWHADLYRLTSTLEIEELGLSEAMQNAVCLIEWPDRLGQLTPKDALTLAFSPGSMPDARHVTAKWGATKWADKLHGAIA